MSLSQKHSGKVLVPWFNITEWKAVYNLIYTEYTQDWPKALEVLKIWKLRTPLLSAGVEGTLILLEALLVDTHRRSSYEITHIFSTSLVRFLNLCAANSDKQGTFYKTALKNGLPKWLISIRHDIAHSHNVPSQSMLELSLKFCLDWLKEKYWEMQDECMSDLIVDQVDDTSLEDAVHIYIHLSQSEGILEDNRELMERINKFISSQGRSQLSAKKILEQVTIALKDIIKSNTQEAADKIFTLLVDNYFILLTDFEVDMFGKKKIPRSFISKWNNLLNILHETEIMPYFTYKLFDFVCDIRHDLLHQEVASLWIQEIFRGLINQKNNIENKEALHFTGRNSCMKDKNFVTEVLEKLTPFTLTFIQEILEYNDAPSQFIEDAQSLISPFYSSNHNGAGNISTVDDLNSNVTDFVMGEASSDMQVEANSRWTIIEDTAPFCNLPLGILPHQSRNVNPLLDL